MDVYSGFNPAGCLVSEKYDGICGVWDGARLTTRDGNPIAAPAWFTAGLPNAPLRGELWCGRGQFETAFSICMAADSGDRWRDVRLMVFDAPAGAALGEHAEPVARWAVDSVAAVDAERDRLVADGAEGIVIRTPDGIDYKYKPIDDDDAEIIGHVEGKGRNAGRCGALVVRDRAGREFRIGNGLSHAQRDHPPAVGSLVTFEYQGRTRTGKPRFASLLCVRAERSLAMDAA